MSKLIRDITAEEIETYQRDGIVCLRGLFDMAWVERLRWRELIWRINDASIEIPGPNSIHECAGKPWVLRILHPVHDWLTRIIAGLKFY